jgi:peptidyl-prolyl cis-trans isomerase A (cyclophilin A)
MRNKRAIVIGLVAGILAATSAVANAANPVVVMKTSMGEIVIELDQAKAPISTANFLAYTNDKFYDGTVFHRIIPTFMIQGGGFTPDMQQKPTKPPIKNEAANGLKNVRGSIAMARTSDPNSATAQFFINVVDNPALDYRGDGPSEIGYAVFGKVTKGMEIVDKIKAVPTTTKAPFANVPVTPVVIESVTVQK